MFKKFSIIFASIISLMAMTETAFAGVIVDVVTQNVGSPGTELEFAL